MNKEKREKLVAILMIIGIFVFVALVPVKKTELRKPKQMPDQVFRFRVIFPATKDTGTAYIKIPYNKTFFRVKTNS